METARAIYGPNVRPDPRWREFEFGEWEGLTWEQIVERWPQYGEQTGTAAKRYAPPGGETFEAVAARVASALDDLRGGGYEHALVVTHAGPLHAMLHAFFGELPVRFTPASVTRVRLEGERPELTLLNDVAHL
jgi:probable phosphoglycerate mutase